MDTKKTLVWALCLSTLLCAVALLCFKGIKIHHELPGKRDIVVPESERTIEFKLREGREPIRFNIKTPEQKIRIEKPD